MVERRKELNQRYHRKKKLAKLKSRLFAAKDEKTREAVLAKIKLVSPFWSEAALKAGAAPAAAPAKKSKK